MREGRRDFEGREQAGVNEYMEVRVDGLGGHGISS